MIMGSNDKPKFVKFMNFDDDANKVLNKAIYYATSEDCSVINEVHLFLALVEKTKLGDKITEHLNATFDMLYSSYQYLASMGEYGTAGGSYPGMPLDYLSREVFLVITSSAQRAMSFGKSVSPEALFDELLSINSECLERFFDYISLDPDELQDMQDKEFHIPDELEDYVKDLNESVLDEQETICNVDKYVDEMVEILGRKKKANPCLVGEPGVGKTTIVRKFIQKIVSGDVPSSLLNMHVCEINGSTLSAGTRYRGDYEERLKSLIDWATKQDVILFIDEIHTFLKSGDTGNGSEAPTGNAIKQGLSDGSIRIIGATTYEEYHRSIEKDKAFNRRIQLVEIKEPTVDAAIEMISNSIVDYSTFHKLDIPKEAIEASVRLSSRYMKSQFLPDKAYTVIDQTCARVKLTGKKYIDRADVANTISKITGVSVDKLGDNEASSLLNLESSLSKNLIGQKSAVQTVAKAIRRAKAGVSDGDKPLATLMFVGPTGVGKTELCKVLSEEVGVGRDSFVKLDMSEYSTQESVTKLVGAAPGYIGYSEEPILLKKVKHNPSSIVLLDEIEKAHPNVFNTLLQLFDEGRLTASSGETVDFTNCIIVMTSNAGYGADGMRKKSLGFDTGSNQNNTDDKEKIARKALEETFKPEFLNRIDKIVIFDSLTKDECRDITKLLLNKLNKRLEHKKIKLNFTDKLVDRMLDRGYSDKFGARNIRREIQDTLEDVISESILKGELPENSTADVDYNSDTDSVEILNVVTESEPESNDTDLSMKFNIRKTPISFDKELMPKK
jgi:ATP-dependent Clp protease ATP-binding subunit ClpC